MGLFRDIAGAAIGGAGGAAAASGGGKKRSVGQDLEEAGKKRLEEGGKRPGVDTSQYSVGSMGLSGSVSDAAPDYLSNGRKKRTNGKDRG